MFQQRIMPDILCPNAALRNQRNNVTNVAHCKCKISPAVLICFTIKRLLFVENLFTVNRTCIYIVNSRPKSVFKDQEAIKCFSSLHDKYVIVPADKAPNIILLRMHNQGIRHS